MALASIIESLDKVDPIFHEHYREDTKLGKFVLDITDIEGLPRVRSLKDEAAQARIANKDIKSKLTSYEALGDMADVVARLDKYPELEAAANGKLDDAKINDIVEGRLKSKLGPIEREKQTLAQQNAELISRVQGFEVQQVQRTIADDVRSATSKMKVVESAVEDITLLAERVFTIDEGGRVVTKDNVGVTPGISVDVWLTEMQSKRPHWWGPSAGGGAPGNRGGVGGGANPWSKDSWNMTEQARIYTENPARAEQLAKSAGTKIGGMKPTK